MLKPTVHLNGTSLQELCRQNEYARRGVRNALAALNEAAPHGRDYYTQGPAAINVAIDQHVARLHKIEEVLKELEEIGEYLANQPVRS